MVVALLADEISIMQRIERYSNNIFGFVNMDDGQNTEDVAKQALVFMVSCLEGK